MLIQLLTVTALLSGPAQAQRPVPSEAPPKPQPPHIGALGITGATMAAASLGVVIAGSVNLTTNFAFAFDPTIAEAIRRPNGSARALLGLGIVGVAAGVTSLAFDLALRRRGRERGRLAILPQVTPTSGGVWLTGRF